MKCKLISTGAELLCFVDDRFEECDLKKEIELSEDINMKIILFQDDYFQEILEVCKKFYGNIEVHIVGCASNDLIQFLQNKKNEKIVKRIIVSSQDVYTTLLFDEIEYGTEIWEWLGISNGLLGLDTGIRMKDIRNLIPHVEEVAEYILRYQPVNDLEKIILLDIWFQKNVQYIKSKESSCQNKIYVCEDMDRKSISQDVLLNHFGVCEDISFTAALILNNSRMGINCRQVSAMEMGHSWNIVSCFGKDYYFDFTQNITRNPNKISGALKAKSYYSGCTLMGKDDAVGKYGFSSEYKNDKISNTSFNRDEIQKTLDHLESRGVELTWPDIKVMESYLIEKDN